MNQLKRLREAKGLSTRELGTLLGIKYGTISRMENYTQQIPEDYAIKLADFFKVSLDELMGRSFIGTNETKIIVKEMPITYNVILFKMEELSNRELSSIIGAAEYILQKRTQTAKKAETSSENAEAWGTGNLTPKR